MTDRSNLTRVVESIAAVPRGVSSRDLLAAILEGLRHGPDPDQILAAALLRVYDDIAVHYDPARRGSSGTSPVHNAGPDKALRQIPHEAGVAIDLGATPRMVIGALVNGLTGRINGRRERAAADAMWTAYDDVVRSIPPTPPPGSGRDTYTTASCREHRHGKCRGGWRAPSGWTPCTCTCHAHAEETS